jgi:hypothetical protein
MESAEPLFPGRIQLGMHTNGPTLYTKFVFHDLWLLEDLFWKSINIIYFINVG